MSGITLLDDGKCFGCGKNNPVGLKLDFQKQGDEYVTDYVPREEHQGWSGITHGGILSTVLDEAMGRMAWEEGYHTVTAEMTVRFKKPCYTGMKLRIAARITGEEGRRVYTSAQAVDEDGRIISEATAVMVKV